MIICRHRYRERCGPTDERVNLTVGQITPYQGNDIEGYRASMPVLHTATHLGHHPVFGPPTGRTAAWYGVPNSFIKNMDGQWKYVSGNTDIKC